MKSVETKKNEVREITSDISRMKGKYLVYDLKRSWREDFLDKGSGEVVSIERKERSTKEEPCYKLRNCQEYSFL